MSVTITVYIPACELRVQVTFGIVSSLATLVELWTIFMNKIMRSPYSVERKIVSDYSTPVPIWMVQEAASKTEKNKLDIRWDIVDDLALFVTTTVGYKKNIIVAERWVLSLICETSAIVSSEAASVNKVVLYWNVGQSYACMMAKGSMDVWPGHSFYMTVNNFVTAYLYLPKEREIWWSSECARQEHP